MTERQTPYRRQTLQVELILGWLVLATVVLMLGRGVQLTLLDRTLAGDYPQFTRAQHLERVTRGDEFLLSLGLVRFLGLAALAIVFPRWILRAATFSRRRTDRTRLVSGLGLAYPYVVLRDLWIQATGAGRDRHLLTLWWSARLGWLALWTLGLCVSYQRIVNEYEPLSRWPHWFDLLADGALVLAAILAYPIVRTIHRPAALLHPAPASR